MTLKLPLAQTKLRHSLLRSTRPQAVALVRTTHKYANEHKNGFSRKERAKGDYYRLSRRDFNQACYQDAKIFLLLPPSAIESSDKEAEN